MMKPMPFEHAGPDEATGTYKIGSLDSPSHLVWKAFGAPNIHVNPSHEPMPKVRCEWIIRFDDGLVCNIHDWKTSGPIYSIDEWTIGGTRESRDRLFSYIAHHIGMAQITS